jgi:hypothetical protein
MPSGDWNPDARLRQLHIEIDLSDADSHVTHAGIGYFVRLPSGREHPGGVTVHSPGGDPYVVPPDHEPPAGTISEPYALADEELTRLLNEIGRRMIAAAYEHEGLRLG